MQGRIQIFLRRGGRILKKFSKILSIFFLKVDQIKFPRSSKSLIKFCAAHAKFGKKRSKKEVSRHFLENFDQKIAFFCRALPPRN